MKRWIMLLNVAACILFCFGSTVCSEEGRNVVRVDEDLLSVDFIDAENGWACGRWGTVIRTEDGGNTWSKQPTPTEYTLSSICFIDAQMGVAVGDMGEIIVTRDGGNTWIRKTSPVSYFLMDVVLVSRNEGFIVTEQTHILSTDDGGENWRVVFKDDDYILKSVSFADSQTGWAVGEYGYIYHTSDGGVSWKKQAGFFGLSPDTGDILGGTFLFDVVAIDAQTAWAVGIDSYAICTEDGGQTWREIALGGRKTELFTVSTNRRGRIVIGGNGILMESLDTGHNWEVVDLAPPFPYGWLYHITHPAMKMPFLSKGQVSSDGVNASMAGQEDVFWVCGKDGVVYKSTSSSWRQVHPLPY